MNKQNIKTKSSLLVEYKWNERRKSKMQYEMEKKENQSNNEIKQTRIKKTKWK